MISRLLLSLLVPINLLIVPFLIVFWANFTNLHLSIEFFLAEIAVTAAAAFLLILCLLAVLPKAWSKVFQLGLLYISISAWLMTHFFIGDYGFLQGKEPNWSEHLYNGAWELTLLAVLVAFVYWQRSVLLENIPFISVMLIATGAGFLWPAIPDRNPEHRFVFNDQGIFELSSNENVIVIVLDSIQADVVNEIFEKNHELASAFRGFTFFRNSVSAFPKTYTSIPSILTGSSFDNSTPLAKFQQEAFKSSLPSVFKDEGYDVRLWSSAPQVLPNVPGIADNLTGGDTDVVGTDAMLSRDKHILYNMMLFRLTPHFLKPTVYNGGEFLIGERQATSSGCSLNAEQRKFSREHKTFDSDLFDRFIACTSTSRDESAFRFLHLQGAHAPLYFNERYEFIGRQSISRDSYRNQTEGVLLAAAAMLKRLQDLEVYDDTVIAIVSDHGASDYGSVGIKLEQPGLPPALVDSETSDVPPYIIQAGLPLVLIKPAGADGFSISDAPVELTDLPATIADLTDSVSRSFSGESMFRLTDPERVRRHRYYRFSGWDVDYIVPLDEYLVRGFSWYKSSWRKSDRDLNINARQSFSGELISLLVPDSRQTGWSKPRPSGVLIEKDASVSLTKNHNLPVILQLNHSLYRRDESESEHIEVYIDESKLGEWIFRGNDEQRGKSLFIPSDIAADLSGKKLRFVSSSDKSDVRFRELRLTPISDFETQVGESISFGHGGVGNSYLLNGWLPPKSESTASLGHQSAVFFRMNPVPSGPVQIDIGWQAFVYPEYERRDVDIVINGELMSERQLTDRQRRRETIILPETSYSSTNGGVYIEFRHKNPVRPSFHNPKWDKHLRSVALAEISLGQVSK